MSLLSSNIRGKYSPWPWVNKVEGSILFPILILILLITILLSTVILYGSYHNVLIARKANDIKACYLAESALQFALRKLSIDGYDVIGSRQSARIDGAGTIEYLIQPYGTYLLCTGRGLAGKSKVELQGLLGRSPGPEFSPAINLGGTDYPLVVAGNTKIKGDVIVSSAGVIPGKYKGREFRGSILVDGQILKDRISRMPPIDKSSYDAFISSLESDDRDPDTTIDVFYILTDDEIHEIQRYPRPMFKSSLTINLDNGNLEMSNSFYKVSGDLRISGKTKIHGFGTLKVNGDATIEGRAELRDLVIICEGEVLIEGNAVIMCQIISKTKISVEEIAEIRRPGVLIVDSHSRKGMIEYGSESISDGSALLLAEDFQYGKGDKKKVPRIILRPGCEWQGLIYSEGFTTIMGRLTGNISTNGFYIYSEPTAYLNWLVDAKISADSSMSSFIIPEILKPSGRPSYAYYY